MPENDEYAHKLRLVDFLRGPVIDSMYKGLWELSDTILKGEITNSTEYESAAVVVVRADNDEYKRQLDVAKDEFEKILELNGVDDYAEYAQLRLDAIENAYEFSTAVSTAVDAIGNIVSRIETGELTDIEAMATELETVLHVLHEKDDEISARSAVLREKAEALKKDKEL